MRETVLLLLKGGVIGVANIIPGVSGGTMAVVLGLYERVIDAIGNFATRPDRRRDYALLLARIGIGAVAAIWLLSSVMDYLLTHHEAPTYLFFIGLIAGSIPSVFRAHHDMRTSPSAIAAFVAGAAVILAVWLLFPDPETAKTAAKEAATEGASPSVAWWMLFVGGIFAGGSMIVPGVSGSFVLVLMGLYPVVIHAIRHTEPGRLAVIAAGVGVGIWAFARLIDVLMRRCPRQTFYFILGLVIASLVPIFPGMPTGAAQIAIAIGCVAVGFVLSWLLGRVQGGRSAPPAESA